MKKIIFIGLLTVSSTLLFAGNTENASKIYDYRNYISTATSKTFNINLGNGLTSGCAATTETHSFIRTVNINNIDVVKTITKSTAAPESLLCVEREVKQTQAPAQLLLVSNYRKVNGGNTINQLITFDTSVTQLTSAMEMGKSFGDGAVRTSTNVTTGQSNQSGFTYTASLVGVEPLMEMTINDLPRTFENCLIFNIQKNSIVRTDWLCPGVGLVKRVSNSNSMLTLTNIIE